MKVAYDSKRIAGYDVDFIYDPESKNWGFKVPALHIVGGDKTRPDAERMAREAIEFTLEDDGHRGGHLSAKWAALAIAAGVIAFVAAARKALGGLRQLTLR